jgi:very-short-patch-repair endonuclease
MYKKWNEEEIEYLKELYVIKGLSQIEICPFFNKIYNRTCDSIWIKIKRLKLFHTKDQTRLIKSRLNSGDKNGMFGKTSAMKGLTKDNSVLMRNKSDKLSKTRKKMYKEGRLPDMSGTKNPMFGKKPWCFGLTKETNESLKSIGKKSSINAKNRWNNKTEDEKKEAIKQLNNAMIQTKKPTKIEVAMKSFLDENEIKNKKNYTINNFLVDFYLTDYNFVIECDGDYWHANPKFFSNKTLTVPQLKNIERDKRKNEMLLNENIPFLRFWECDINKDFKSVKNKILTSII